jgi:hypothetical protein
MSKKKGFSWGKLAEAGIGVYIMLPGLEDVAAGGTTVLPSFYLGLGMVLHALGRR